MITKSKSRERVNKARAVLSNLTDQQKQKLLDNGVVTTIEGRVLSDYNTMLVYIQSPGATVVGGFNQWKQVGRQVRKGAAGLSIWIPTSKKNELEEDETYFLTGTVFDISQTEPIMEVVKA